MIMTMASKCPINGFSKIRSYHRLWRDGEMVIGSGCMFSSFSVGSVKACLRVIDNYQAKGGDSTTL